MSHSSPLTPPPDWETTRQRLHDPEATLRQEALFTLLDQRWPLADTLLLEALFDPQPVLRQMAAEGLAELIRDETLEALAEILRAEDAAARSAAMSLLARLGARALPVLIPRLADAEADVRIFTANVLGELGHQAATEPLLSALTDPHENVRYAAAEALGKLKDRRATPALLRAVEEDEWVRFAAIEALGEIADPRAIEPLTALLHSEPWLRLPAIEALGQMGDADTGALLQRYLNDNQMVNHAVIAALGAIDAREGTRLLAELNQPGLAQTLIEALASTYPAVRQSAVVALGWVGQPDTLPALLPRLNDEAEEVREATRQSLIHFGARQPAALIESFQAPHSDHRLWIAEALSHISQPEAMEALCAGLADTSTPVRVACARGLGLARHPHAVVPLIESLNDPEAEVRRASANALREMPSAKAIPKLLRLLEDVAAEVRAEAALTLAHFAHPDSTTLTGVNAHDIVNQIAPLTHSSRAETREAAVQTLGRLTEAKATEAVVAALGHPEASTRRAAAQALALTHHTAPEVVAALTKTLLDEDWTVRKQVVDTLGQFDFELTGPSLHTALHDDSLWVRYAAARQMGEHRDGTALPRLIELIQNDVEPVKLAAASAAGQLKDVRAVPALLSLTQHTDPDLRRAAAEALGQLRDPQSEAALIQLLSDSAALVRRTAQMALDQFGPALSDAAHAALARVQQAPEARPRSMEQVVVR